MNNHKSTHILYGPHWSIFMFMYFDLEWEWNFFPSWNLYPKSCFTCTLKSDIPVNTQGKWGKGVGELVTPPPPPHFFFNASQLHLAGWHELKVTKHSSTGYTSLVTLTHQRSLPPPPPPPPPCTAIVQLSPGVVGSSPLILTCVYQGFLRYFSLTPSPPPNPVIPFVKVDLSVFFYILSSMNTEGLINQLLYWEYCKQQSGNRHFDPVCKDWDTQTHQSN